MEQQQSRQERRRRVANVALSALMAFVLIQGLVKLVSVAVRINKPFGGVVLMRTRYQNRTVINPTTPSHWPGLGENRLHLDDVILEINGQPAGIFDRIFAEAGERSEENVTYLVERDGSQLSVEGPVVPFTLDMFIEFKMPSFIVGLGFWMVGLFVWLVRPNDEVHRVFLLCTACAAAIPFHMNHGFTDSFVSNLLAIFTRVPFWPLLGAALFHLASVFPEEHRHPALYKVRACWYVPAALIILVDEVPYVYDVMYGVHTQQVARLARITTSLSIVAILLGGLFMLGRYLYLLLTSPSRRVRRQMGVFSLGVLVGVVFPMISFLIVGWSGREWNSPLPQYLALLAVFSLAYAILRYQLFSAKGPLMVGFAIVFLSSMLAYLYLFVFQILLGWGLNVFVLFVAVICTSLFWVVDHPLQYPFAHFLRRGTINYRILQAFNAAVSAADDLDRLPGVIIDVLHRELELDYAMMWSYDETSNTLQLVALSGGVDQQGLPKRLELDQGFAQAVVDQPRPVRSQEERWPDYMPTLMTSLQTVEVAAFVPLVGPEHLVGFLLLGQKTSDEIFDDEDIRLLEIIAQQAALLAVVTRQVKELREIPRRVARAQERERYRLAQELHDTVQQSLGRLPFYLEMIRQRMETDLEEVDRVITECQEDIKRASADLRGIRQNLTPGLLEERGLVTALESLASRLSLHRRLKFHHRVAGQIDAVLSKEAKHALYRVFQQGIDNVIQHAEASNIYLTLELWNRRAEFSIRDDGKGFLVQDVRKLIGDRYSGLQSMKDRVELLGGRLTVESGPSGRGTVIRGYVPVG